MTDQEKLEKENKVRRAISGHTGTDGYHRLSIICPNLVFTDGVKSLCESAGAFWLADTIASYMTPRVRGEPFQVWELRYTPEEGRAAAILTGRTDGAPYGKLLAEQKIEFTDFPLPEGIALYVEHGSDCGEPILVCLLPSEH
jgi:hypothetical protein